MGRIVTVIDKMQKGYRYELTEPTGRNFDKSFRPELTPKQMFSLGVFGGRYMRDCQEEFPKEWFEKARLFQIGLAGHDKKLNFFGVDASQPLYIWQEKGWIHPDDPRGWFQWYCRYYMGRRHEDDARQIKRWRAFRRHYMVVKNNCFERDLNCQKSSAKLYCTGLMTAVRYDS